MSLMNAAGGSLTEVVEQAIVAALDDGATAEVHGTGGHFTIRAVSTAFEGKNRVQQHQMVYAALQGRMGTELHALALQTGVPE